MESTTTWVTSRTSIFIFFCPANLVLLPLMATSIPSVYDLPIYLVVISLLEHTLRYFLATSYIHSSSVSTSDQLPILTRTCIRTTSFLIRFIGRSHMFHVRSKFLLILTCFCFIPSAFYGIYCSGFCNRLINVSFCFNLDVLWP